VCATFVAVVLVTAPSPKVQERFVIAPVEASVKATDSGAAPLAGLLVKLATGAGGGAFVTTM
jgi:hypothetical protein